MFVTTSPEQRIGILVATDARQRLAMTPNRWELGRLEPGQATEPTSGHERALYAFMHVNEAAPPNHPAYPREIARPQRQTTVQLGSMMQCPSASAAKPTFLPRGVSRPGLGLLHRPPRDPPYGPSAR